MSRRRRSGAAAGRIPSVDVSQVPSGQASAAQAAVASALDRLDPRLQHEYLTTEGLMDVIHGAIFGEPHMDREVFQPVQDASEAAGSGITKAVLSAARVAVRRGNAGAGTVLSCGLQVRVVYERPTFYVELRQGDAVLVLRFEKDTREGGFMSFIHQIRSEARAAIAMIATLVSSWDAVGRGLVEAPLAVHSTVMSAPVRSRSSERAAVA